MSQFVRIAAIAALVSVAGHVGAHDLSAPSTAIQPVVDHYGTLSVADPYRWLEDGAAGAVQAWSQSQDERTRKYLDALALRQPIFDQLMRQTAAGSAHFYGLHAASDKVFAYLDQPPKQQPMIAVMDRHADPGTARVVLDPNALNPQGTTAIDWYVPSPDGETVTVSLSENGSEDGTLHLFQVSTGKEIDTAIPRVQFPTAGGSLAWRADSRAFWYTRFPGPDRPAAEQHFFQRIFFHVLGDDPAKDAYVLGKDFPKIAEIYLSTRSNPNHVLVTVANGDGGEFETYVISKDQRVQQLTHFKDQIVSATLGADDTVYLVSHHDAPRGKLLSVSLKRPSLGQARLLVAESQSVMQPGGEFGGEPITVTNDSLYVREIEGGPSRVAIYDHAGHPKGSLPLPAVAAVNEVEPLRDGSILYSVDTYTRPTYFLRFTPGQAQSAAQETKLVLTSPVSFDDAEVLRDFVTSKDGTRVPINILRRKNTKLDGSNPVLLTGYGGYAVSLTPGFLGPTARLWLDGGGVLVIANLRGGGEYGEAWHRAGSLTNKQHVFDDFIAAAEYLISKHYTTSPHLAIMGGSNGGLLMGAAFTQRPELFRAVVSRVGIYDMLRVELDPNGQFNTTEFGSVRNPGQFKALYAYSPYHHVAAGAKYPAVFMATGATDGRVNPAHSRKMIARLQAATASEHPVYLSISTHAGHGIGSALSIRVNQSADLYSFLFDQLGMSLHAPAP